jgi:hypothetical protein
VRVIWAIREKLAFQAKAIKWLVRFAIAAGGIALQIIACV